MTITYHGSFPIELTWTEFLKVQSENLSLDKIAHIKHTLLTDGVYHGGDDMEAIYILTASKEEIEAFRSSN